MSCYAKHPDIDGVECWHGPGHSGDHGKENRSWPNADDKLRKEIAALRAQNERLVSALNGCLSNENRWWEKAQAAVDEAGATP